MSLEKVVLRCFRTPVSLSHFSFVETCVHPGEQVELRDDLLVVCFGNRLVTPVRERAGDP